MEIFFPANVQRLWSPEGGSYSTLEAEDFFFSLFSFWFSSRNSAWSSKRNVRWSWREESPFSFPPPFLWIDDAERGGKMGIEYLRKRGKEGGELEVNEEEGVVFLFFFFPPFSLLY